MNCRKILNLTVFHKQHFEFLVSTFIEEFVVLGKAELYTKISTIITDLLRKQKFSGNRLHILKEFYKVLVQV